MDNNAVPKINIPLDSGDVPLNQPFPKEVANAPIVGIAEQVGQTALESALHPDEAEAKITLAKEQEKAEQKEINAWKEQSPMKKLGAQIKGAAIAIVKPEEGKKQDSKRKTSDPLVKILVIIGVIVVMIGLITFFSQAFLGILLMLAGALVITFAVFAPIHAAKRV